VRIHTPQRSSPPNPERARPGRAALVTALATVALLMLPPLAVAQSAPPSTLTGEFLSALEPPFGSTGTVEGTMNCDPAGESEITYRAEGTATGPYPGTFEETGTVRLGPLQTRGDGGDYGQIYGDVEFVEVSFVIRSGSTTIRGTKTFESTQAELASLCADAERYPGAGAQYPLLSSSKANVHYETTITTPEGTFHDEGTSYLDVQFGEERLPDGGTRTVDGMTETYRSALPAAEPVVLDRDGDGVDDEADNCPAVANPGQTDTDGDGQGNACDATPNGDTDNDGIDNNSDNCPAVANPGQTDTDGDGQGNACDATPNGDTDNDGIDNNSDNCPAVANPGQTDTDGDGQGNACDATPNGDTDNDGIDNNSDNCPNAANADQADTDGDGQGDACDATPHGDQDNDGVDNNADNCPANANPNQTDSDHDGAGDACDATPHGVPSNKDQCKKDGWMAYGLFKNQGDCVSYVATGGKNQPAGS
jgi:hypothetical protein